MCFYLGIQYFQTIILHVKNKKRIIYNIPILYYIIYIYFYICFERTFVLQQMHRHIINIIKLNKDPDDFNNLNLRFEMRCFHKLFFQTI